MTLALTFITYSYVLIIGFYTNDNMTWDPIYFLSWNRRILLSYF